MSSTVPHRSNVQTEATITVPKTAVSQVVCTILTEAATSPVDQLTLAAIAATVGTILTAEHPGDTVRLSVDVAFWLHCGSYALGVYDLDETAEATYRHSAVIAEVQIQTAFLEQQPDAYDELCRARDIYLTRGGDAHLS